MTQAVQAKNDHASFSENVGLAVGTLISTAGVGYLMVAHSSFELTRFSPQDLKTMALAMLFLVGGPASGSYLSRQSERDLKGSVAVLPVVGLVMAIQQLIVGIKW